MCGRRLSWTTQSSPWTRSPFAFHQLTAIYIFLVLILVCFFFDCVSPPPLSSFFHSFTFSAGGPGSRKFLVNPSACDGAHEGFSDNECVNEPGQSGEEPSDGKEDFSCLVRWTTAKMSKLAKTSSRAGWRYSSCSCSGLHGVCLYVREIEGNIQEDEKEKASPFLYSFILRTVRDLLDISMEEKSWILSDR